MGGGFARLAGSSVRWAATDGGSLVGRAIAHRDGEVGALRDVGRDGGIRGGGGWGGGDGGEDDNIMGRGMGRGRGRVVRLVSTSDAQTTCTGVIFLILREVVC